MSSGERSRGQKFKIILSKEADKYYKKVDISTAKRLDKCFEQLEKNPVWGINIRPLKGERGKYRYRVGSLRIIFGVDLDNRVVMVYLILPRGDVY
jgi:mRNA interferase RelE/StbE